MDFKQASRLKIGQTTNYKSSQFQTPLVPNSENTKSERGEFGVMTEQRTDD